jgi:MFS family permease
MKERMNTADQTSQIAIKPNLKLVYIVGLLVFFYTLFDGAVSFVVPIAVTQIGVSKSIMGIIVGSSSIFGAIFDFILSKILINTHFRRVYLLMFVFCLLCLFFLWQANTFMLFIIVMALWGFYFDLSNFGNFDFISRRTDKKDHSQGFSILWIFRSLGYTIAPLIIGVVMGDVLNWPVFAYMGVFLTIAFGFFLLLTGMTNADKKEIVLKSNGKNISVLLEVQLWKQIGRKMFPVLIMTALLWSIEATFWTVGPFMSESIPHLGGFKGLFLALYTLPPLFIGWFVGPITKKLGKKRTAFYAGIIGSGILGTLAIVPPSVFLLFLVFIASCFLAMCLPSLGGAYADYIVETPHYEKEIEALEDFFTNIGYVVGPIIAGILADKFGNINVFSIIGFGSMMIILFLLKVTPKSIRI